MSQPVAENEIKGEFRLRNAKYNVLIQFRETDYVYFLKFSMHSISPDWYKQRKPTN